MSNCWCQTVDVKLLMSIWCQFLSRFWQFFEKKALSRLMWNWCHIWCQTIDVNVLMLNWRHIWCQTVDVIWCQFLVKVLTIFRKNLFQGQCDVKLTSYLMSNCWCQFLVKNIFQGQFLDVKLTSYLMSNYWC